MPRIPEGRSTIYSLLYRSRATGAVTSDTLNDIFLASTGWNARHDVTGLLLYAHLDAHTPGVFVQWIEGPRGSVLDLFDRLLRDGQHADLDLLHEGPTQSLVGMDGRLFPNWSMRVEFEDAGAVPVTTDQFLAYWLSHKGPLDDETTRFRRRRLRRPFSSAGSGSPRQGR